MLWNKYQTNNHLTQLHKMMIHSATCFDTKRPSSGCLVEHTKRIIQIALLAVISHLLKIYLQFSPFSNVRHLRCLQWTVIYTGCPRRNVPDFDRVFLMLKYTDITQKTYVQSWTVTEIMDREKCGLLAGPRTVPVSWQSYPCPSLSVVSYDGNSAHASPKLHMYFLQGDDVVSHVTSVLRIPLSSIVLGTLRTTVTWVRVLL